jgi:hypothetical protein
VFQAASRHGQPWRRGVFSRARPARCRIPCPMTPGLLLVFALLVLLLVGRGVRR